MDDCHDLDALLKARLPIIVVETREEPRVETLFRERLPRLGRSLEAWSVARGLRRLDLDLPGDPELIDPETLLRSLLERPAPGVFLLADFHPYLDNPVIVRLLRELALNHERTPHVAVLVSHALSVPPELQPHSGRLRLRLPDRERLTELVHEEATGWARDNGRRVRTDRATLERLVGSMTGLTEADARRLIRNAVRDDGAITEDDLPDVQAARFRLLDQGGAIHFEYDTARFAAVGGLKSLKAWLAARERPFVDPDESLEPPRGVLLTGVQGAGKSLAARAVAGSWRLPLLRLETGGLYSKYYGESEANLRRALETAEAVAPCVLWIDEIEKAVAASSSDDGLSRRLLGALLTWMAERRAPVFLVATANDIERLPPELVRKGRFDEIFFVDLPDAEIRAEIFGIHLERRGVDAGAFDTATLAEVSAGFSGAEIEQAVLSALYTARAADRALDAADLVAELERTRPLSVVMAEPLAALRKWARGRTVPAD